MQNLEILVVPVISLMGLAFAFSSILRYMPGTKFTNWAFGILFGGSIVMAMTFPISLGEGFIFDLRSLFLALCVIFSGWRAGLIAFGMALGYRVYLGGGGMMVGVIGLTLAYAISVCWLRFAVPRIKEGPLADIGLGVAINGALAALAFLPKEVALMVVTDLAPVMAVANVICALALGFLFRREKQFYQDSEKLRMHAMLDPLTNLLNRRGTKESVKAAVHSPGQGRALICFDLDNFKWINDQHGHDAGDIVLSTIASRIENAMRGEIIFSRHGGDEFTIYFPTLERTAIACVADRLRRTVASEAVVYKGTLLPITISIGCYWTERAASYDEMLSIADAQLLTSKSKGRNRSTVFLDLAHTDSSETQGQLAFAN